MKRNISPSAVPQLHGNTRALPMRVAAMCKVLVSIFNRYALYFLVTKQLFHHIEFLINSYMLEYIIYENLWCCHFSVLIINLEVLIFLPRSMGLTIE